MKMRNTITGQVFEVNRNRGRVRRAQRRVKAWADLLDPYLNKVGVECRLVMITLTYAVVDGWKAGHIRSFCKIFRDELGDCLVGYSWVAELQRRGAVHYHLVAIVKKGTNIPMPDEAGWWVHGSTRIETARTPYYILTYTGKEYQKSGSFPKGLRIFAVWVHKNVLGRAQRWLLHLSSLPVWLVEQLRGSLDMVGHSVRRVAGGGWQCAGVFYTSPYEVIEDA